MIVLCGVDDFPSGAVTEELASRFARRAEAELVLVGGGAAGEQVERTGATLLFGHAPARGAAAAFRDAPCPVAVAPPGRCAEDWGEVILGAIGDDWSQSAAETAGALAARLGATLRIVWVRPQPADAPWRLYDLERRMLDAIARAAGTDLEIEIDVRDGDPSLELSRAAAERDTAVIVVPADRPPSWFDMLRPSLTTQLVRSTRDLVIVVPREDAPAEPHPDAVSVASTPI